MATTLASLQAGSSAIKYVCAIEGYDRLLTDATPAAALTAWSGTDWTQALDGLFVSLQNRQRIDPYDPFTPGGRCVLSVIDTQNGTDQFGKDVYRRSAGASTVLTTAIDRNDTTITVAANASFATATSELHIGTECIEYSAKVGTTQFTASKRGKYSPFAAGGTGSPRFGQHHRVCKDSNQVQLNPTVSQQPRVWLGRRVGVWMHTVAADGTLNSRADAQLVYAGVIVGVQDDPSTMCTVVELKHILDIVGDSTLGRDIFGGDLGHGLYLQTGRVFGFSDWKTGSPRLTANTLTVVASGATGTNQMNAGNYSVEEVCDKLSSWLGGELQAGRIYGAYSWQSPVTSNVGLRTKCYWTMTHASDIYCNWIIDMPGEVAAFLGISDVEGTTRGQTISIGQDGKTNTVDKIREGDAVPFRSLVFKPTGPGNAQEFSEALRYVVQNERGTFIDQYDSLPAVLKNNVASSGPGNDWGVFLLDEKVLVVASYANNTLTNAWIAPWRMPGNNDTDALGYIGRRVDEPHAGPVTIRQVFILTGSFKKIVNQIFYGSGTNGYNHATYDTGGFGLGVGIPGELLGTEFERSVANMPGADAELAVIFDEATTLPDLLSSDLLLRRASLRWKNEHLEFVVWQSPAGALSVYTFNDSNKAAPAGNQEDHRVPTLESTVFQRAIVKIDFNRDFSVGRNGDYQKSFQIEDQVAVDDSGGETRPLTIKARNTFSDFAGTGGAIEELTKGYLASMPQFSRAARHISRSINMKAWEGIGVGDIVTVEDNFARDPATGARGVNSRYGTVISHNYDPGGPTPGSKHSVRPMVGEVEIRIPDINRYLPYGPGARVDDTQANAGYNAGTFALTCYAHKYSEASEAVDAAGFAAGDKITIVEIDPSNPAAPTTWDRTISTVVGNVVTLTAALAAPAWDATKKYRICFDQYSDAVTRQRDYAYQADEVDQMVQDVEVSYHYSATNDTLTYTANTGTDKAAFHADLAFGDGKSLDAGHETDLINTVNQLIDRRTAHQSPLLWNSFLGVTGGTYQAFFAGPIYCGLDHLGVGVTRSLIVAPFLKSTTGAAGTVRITLSRMMPMQAPSMLPSVSYDNTRFGEVFSQATWTTTNLSWETGASASLSLNVKDLHFGFAWLTIECAGPAATRGLAKCIEGPRTLI